MPRRVLLLPLLLFSASCTVRRPPPSAPMMMPPAPTALDPRASELLERCDASLRAHAAAASAPRADALAALSQQRLLLVMSLEDARKQSAALDQRVLKARHGLRAQAQSELDRALIAEALIDLDEGRELTRPLSKRLSQREEFRDAVEAHALLRDNRARRTRLEAQIDALDATFAQLGSGAPQPQTFPRFGDPPGRPVEPRL